jgi:hypothetical protein
MCSDRSAVDDPDRIGRLLRAFDVRGDDLVRNRVELPPSVGPQDSEPRQPERCECADGRPREHREPSRFQRLTAEKRRHDGGCRNDHSGPTSERPKRGLLAGQCAARLIEGEFVDLGGLRAEIGSPGAHHSDAMQASGRIGEPVGPDWHPTVTKRPSRRGSTQAEPRPVGTTRRLTSLRPRPAGTPRRARSAAGTRRTGGRPCLAGSGRRRRRCSSGSRSRSPRPARAAGSG